MSNMRGINHTTIASGSTLSEAFDVGHARTVALSIPGVVTSCQMFVLGAHVNVAAEFQRLLQIDGSGDFALDVGVGSRQALVEPLAGFNFGKVEALVAQTDTASIAVIRKF
tara:strand:- start:639 stop:971 length:333 start_codon:yes stop_codon:yes gene_type:complete